MVGVLDFHVGPRERGDANLMGVGDTSELNTRTFFECFGDKAHLTDHEFALVPCRPIGTAIEMTAQLIPDAIVGAACDW